LPEDTVQRLAGKKLEPLRKRLRQHRIIAVLLLRVTPTAPFAVESMVAGAFRVRVGDYAIGSLLGIMPGMFANSVVGSQLAAAFEHAGDVNYWAIAAAVVLLAGITIAASVWVAKAS
jgi:uncharacterized membrane protein YdjX (TVP38/TMEM64 family)